MANVIIRSLHTAKGLQVARKELIQQVQHVEKKNFPRREALDFSAEVKKRNVDLVIIVDDAGEFAPSNPKMVAYMLFVHLKAGNTVLLHKICVDCGYRRRGIARFALESQAERLKNHGCTRIELWVDEGNAPARHLYDALGLKEARRVNDYYAVGRTGIQMIWVFH